MRRSRWSLRSRVADLWTLDAVWWALTESTLQSSAREPDALAIETQAESQEQFGLERQLEDFLVANWHKTDLGRDWDIYAEDGDPLAGNQYATDVGRIDVLAKHKRESRRLVVELKRGQTSDQTVGQATRYMGWVKKHLAKVGDKVEAVVIGSEVDDQTRYSATMAPGIRLMRYEVKFTLIPEVDANGVSSRADA